MVELEVLLVVLELRVQPATQEILVTTALVEQVERPAELELRVQPATQETREQMV